MFATTGGWSLVPRIGVIVATHSGSDSGSSDDSEDKQPVRSRHRQKIAKNVEDEILILRMERRSGLGLLSLATRFAQLVA